MCVAAVVFVWCACACSVGICISVCTLVLVTRRHIQTHPCMRAIAAIVRLSIRLEWIFVCVRSHIRAHKTFGNSFQKKKKKMEIIRLNERTSDCDFENWFRRLTLTITSIQMNYQLPSPTFHFNVDDRWKYCFHLFFYHSLLPNKAAKCLVLHDAISSETNIEISFLFCFIHSNHL